MKKKLISVTASLICVLAVGSLAGCSGTTTATQNTEQQNNRAYMSQVNQTMDTLSEKLDLFVEAVSANDAIAMKTQADRALSVLSELESIEAPEALKDVQSLYKEGSSSLKDSLTDYVDAYTSGDPTALSAEALASIQDKYNAGVNSLKEADKKASELPN